MDNKVILYGAGNYGQVILEFLTYCGLEGYVAFICDSDSNLWGG